MYALPPDERAPSVLLVDDDEETLAIGRAILAGPFDVLTASSASEALEVLERGHVGILLTDLQMTGRDGVDLIREASRARRDLICILLSGSDDSRALAECAALPELHRTLRKPVPPGELREIVAHALDVWLLRNRNAALAAENAEIREARRMAVAGVGGRTIEQFESLRESVSVYERQCIAEVLGTLHGNKSAAARRLGLTYRGLLLKMQRYGMMPGRGRIVTDATRP
jgi:DNA-binding NtrC family response regulator